MNEDNKQFMVSDERSYPTKYANNGDWSYLTEDESNEQPPTVEERIKAVLRRYFVVDDNGDPNPSFDEYFTAQEALDKIYDIVGGMN